MIPNTATGLLKHLEKYYSDYNVSKDLDAVLNSCRTERSKELVRKYARERRQASGYKPGSLTHNNHSRIPVARIRTMNKTAKQIHTKEFDVGKKTCLVCRNKWTPKRKDAQVCSDICRQAGVRARKRIVYERCPHGYPLEWCDQVWCSSRVKDMGAMIRPPEPVTDNS